MKTPAVGDIWKWSGTGNFSDMVEYWLLIELDEFNDWHGLCLFGPGRGEHDVLTVSNEFSQHWEFIC